MPPKVSVYEQAAALGVTFDMRSMNDWPAWPLRTVHHLALTGDASEVRAAGTAIRALLTERGQSTGAVSRAVADDWRGVRHALAKGGIEVIAPDAQLGLYTGAAP